ncbi:UNVERIFIED_CONTAM: hypothetical protein GTU68_055533 [Idotea baltica]|nr:hypothetical protein [Idotea baltica]
MTDISHHDRLLIVDFGSQVTQLIARRLRELNIYCEIHPFQNVTPEFLKEFGPKAVILSGGPASVIDDASPRPPAEIFEMGLPVLGVCYGQQVMMHMLGGKVEHGKGTAEFGRAYVTPTQTRIDLLSGWFSENREQVWMSHGDHVSEIAPGFEVYGVSPNAPFAITADLSRNFFAVQFHPEVHHTPNGKKLYENFVRLAGFKGDWTMGAYREEAVRKIREQFIDVFQKYANQIDGAEFLAQGTLYPDVIESVSFSGGPSVTIKSHHNVGGLPEKMGLKLVEPLRELFKDEVRALGHELGLPASFIGRHPFPGPGLAIRCPGEITREKLEILRKADAVYIDQIRKHGLYDEIWQAFVAILPVRTVGVMGDGRTYDFACALRAVTSVDGMTADYYPFTHEFLGETATRIINEVHGINRVTYDITSKPPGTIEWE